MTIKNEKGHEDELYGFRIQTELEVEGGTMWCVKIFRKPSEAGMPPLLAHEARGFGYEGEALDFGQDWTMEHRPYIPEVKASGMRGFIGQVLNESGYADYKTTECPNEDEAQALIDAWISAKRLHDQKIIAERCRVPIGKRKREQTDLEKHIAAKIAKPKAAEEQPGAAT